MRAARSLLALTVAVTISTCGIAGHLATRRSGDRGPTPTSILTSSPPSAAPPALLPPPSGTRSPGLQVSNGHGWSTAGLEGSFAAPGSCHYRSGSEAFDLPDPSCTPGAIDPGVTQGDLEDTICRRGGYTSSVRPPESLTAPAKDASMTAYGDPLPASDTELDHLVPLELGGSSAVANLWAQPDQGRPADFSPSDPYGINAKDGVETVLHDAVCAGRVTLAAAQQAIASDWTTALTLLGVS